MKRTAYFFSALLALVLCASLSAHALDTDVVMVAVGLDSRGEIVTSTPAVAAVYEGATYVDAGSVLTEAEGVQSFRLLVGDKDYPLTFVSTYDSLDIVEFTVENEDNILGLPYANDAYLNEEASIVYLTEGLRELTCGIQLTGCREQNNYYLYSYTLLDGLADTAYFPMAVVDSQGTLVGYVSPSGDVYTYLYDPDAFTASGGAGSSGGGSGGSGGDSGSAGSSGSGETGGSSGSGGGSSGSGGGSVIVPGDHGGSRMPFVEPKSSLLPYIVGAGGAVVLAGIAFAVLRKKKASPVSSSPAQPVPVNVPDTPVRVSDTPVRAPEAIPPTEAAPAAAAGQRVTPVLYGQGGAMDGRRYVLNAPVVIGRTKSCMICYPEDTPGVSREHCTVFWHNGVLVLMDKRSSYGTFLKGMGRLSPEQPVALKSGDSFYLGEAKNGFVLRFE